MIEREIKFEGWKMCFENNKAVLTMQQRFRSEAHELLTEMVNNGSLSVTDDKKLQRYDGVIYSYDTGAGGV